MYRKILPILLILWIFVIGVGAGALARENSSTVPSRSSVQPVGTAQRDDPEDPDADPEDLTELVQDLIHAEGEYQNEYGDIFPYGYRVPELKIDSPAARSINVEIDETIGTLARDQLQLIHDGGDEDPMTYLIDWNASLTDGILSLIVEYRDIWWKPKYFVYVYDINRDLRLDNFDLIELFGYSEDDFLASVRDAAGWEYISANEGVPAEYRGEMYDDRYAFTISDENISFENLMIYLESDGRVAVLARIGSMAGAGWYYHVVYPFEAVG